MLAISDPTSHTDRAGDPRARDLRLLWPTATVAVMNVRSRVYRGSFVQRPARAAVATPAVERANPCWRNLPVSVGLGRSLLRGPSKGTTRVSTS